MNRSELTELCNKAVVIPVSAIPAQRFQCVLNKQNCTITLKKRGHYCYFSLIAGGKVITQNSICLCGNNLVPYASRGFDGSIFFIDANGHYSIPNYKEFGLRFKLIYVPFNIDSVDIQSV